MKLHPSLSALAVDFGKSLRRYLFIIPLSFFSIIVSIYSNGFLIAQDCFDSINIGTGVLLEDCDQDGIPDACEIVPQIETSSTPPYYTVLHSQALATIDLDRDGNRELVVGTQVFRLNPAGQFDIVSEIPLSSGEPIDIRIADFNKDGLEDAVFLSRFPGGIHTLDVLLQREGQEFELTFSETVRRSRPSFCSHGSQQNPVAIGDFDGDGDFDILLAPGADTSTRILVFLNQGEGKFHRQTAPGGGPNIIEVLFEDLNFDGLPDLLFSSLEEPFVSIRFNLGDGSYSSPPHDLNLRHAVENLTLADFDGDKDLDLAFKDTCQTETQIMWKEGEDFNPPIPSGASSSFANLQAKDLNGDGMSEIISNVQRQFSWSINLGRRTFQTKGFNIGMLGSKLIIEDFNGDKIDDVVVSGNKDNQFLLIVGRDELEFHPPVQTSSQFGFIISGDFNEDGYKDLVSRSEDSKIQVTLFDQEKKVISNTKLKNSVNVQAVTLIDLDADNQPDLAASITTDEGGDLIFFLNRAGNFEEVHRIESVGFIPDLDAADIDGDGFEDLAIPRGPRWFRNQGDLSFDSPIVLGNSNNGQIVRIVDLNGDQRLDIISDQGGFRSEVDIYFASPQGFLPGQAVVADQLPLVDIDYGDVDGDSTTDLVITETCSTCALTRTEIVVLLQKEPGRFIIHEWLGGAPNLHFNLQPFSIHKTELLDFDFDGDLDLITHGDFTFFGNTFYMNRGNANFDFAKRVQVPTFRDSTVTDLNSDGLLELITQPGTLRFFDVSIQPPSESDIDKDGIPDRCSTPQFFRRGDASQDGLVDLTDPIVTLSAIFLGEGPLPCEDAADSNDDGTLDTSDPVATLVYLFLGGGPLPSPGIIRCGVDPSEDDLECLEPSNDCLEG